MTPLVSILVPAYNVEAFLTQCLESIVNQTYKNIQVVVVDDGSTDGTLAIAMQFVERYNFISAVHQENQGLPLTRKKLLSLAKGDYVQFVDADDWIEPDMIERMLKATAETGADITVCGNLREMLNETLRKPFVKHPTIIDGKEAVIKELLRHNILNGSLCNKLVPRHLYDDLSFDKDVWYGEDCHLFWQVLNHGVERIYIMTDCLYHYRMNNMSITHTSFNYKMMTGHLVWRKICSDVHIDWPSMARLGKAAYAVSDMWLMYYASLANYTPDDNIRTFQLNVRKNLFNIIATNLIAKKKILYAIVASFSYRLSGAIIRALDKKSSYQDVY